MARGTTNNPLANALDRRIRTVIEETMESAMRDSIRRIVQEELAVALGGAAAPASPRQTRVARAGKVAGRRGGARAAAGQRMCEVVGCKRPYRSQGYCAAHYQSARKHGWPMPAPKDFRAPPPAPRGRPPRDASAAD